MVSIALVEHLLQQRAPRTAAWVVQKDPNLKREIERKAAVSRDWANYLRILTGQLERLDSAVAGVYDWRTTSGDAEEFAVPSEHVFLVDDPISASAFSLAMKHVENLQGLIALDAEWRPDTAGSNNVPALMQVACGAEDSRVQPQVWLVDLCRLLDPCQEMQTAARTVDEALHAVFGSSAVRIIGFSFQGDLDKLALLPSWRFPHVARRVIDLYSACSMADARITGRTQNGHTAGLAKQLKRWTGLTLNKTMQCSDWVHRPLSSAQITYAAADAACLFSLFAALASSWPATLVECERKPSSHSTARAATFVAPIINIDTGGDYQEPFKLVEEVVVSASCRGMDCCKLVPASDASLQQCIELNALCFVVLPLQSPNRPKQRGTPEKILVLTPASSTVDLKLLGNWLGVSRRRLRMASDSECAEDFGAVPGIVPPFPLAPGVRLVASHALAAPRTTWYASSGHPDWRLVIRDLEQSEPLLLACSGAVMTAKSVPDDQFSEVELEWLPDEAQSLQSLDEAVQRFTSKRFKNSYGNGADLPEFCAIVDSALAPLARKLRMVGIDCQVAGEYVREDEPGLQGLQRVKVDISQQDIDLRRSAALGRLIVVSSRRSHDIPGVYYRLLSIDADDQFAELTEVFGLHAFVESGASRCGICNATEWRTLQPNDVNGQVPQTVLESGVEFYQCGSCGQIFWEGAKYNSTMDSLRARVPDRLVGSGGYPATTVAPSTVSASPKSPRSLHLRRPNCLKMHLLSVILVATTLWQHLKISNRVSACTRHSMSASASLGRLPRLRRHPAASSDRIGHGADVPFIGQLGNRRRSPTS